MVRLTDVFSKRKRSRIMSRIRSSGTRPERALRALLRALTDRRLRYNCGSLPGSPDVAIHSLRLAVFMEGCFWHGCPKHGRIPKSNVDFWRAKIARTKRRDARNRSELKGLGWTVWRVWEHDLLERELPRTRRNLRRRLRRLEGSL
jgi:DNA mismatch endonuclease (patch repair protein)